MNVYFLSLACCLLCRGSLWLLAIVKNIILEMQCSGHSCDLQFVCGIVEIYWDLP